MLCLPVCLYVLCVCIRNGDLKQVCNRHCDSLQVYRRWGGDGDSKHGNGVGMGTKVVPVQLSNVLL